MVVTEVSAAVPPWQIRSELPGRVRLHCLGLAESEALRRHCRTVLTGCHWLEGFLGRLGGDGGRFRRDVGGRLGQFVGPCRRAGGEGQKGDERPQDPGLE